MANVKFKNNMDKTIQINIKFKYFKRVFTKESFNGTSFTGRSLNKVLQFRAYFGQIR